MTNQEINYNYEQLWNIPGSMQPWNMRLENPQASQFGQYALIGVEQAGLELHHEVQIIDESGFPIAGIWVIFGFPGGGPDIGLGVSGRNYWVGAPAVLRGNAQKTPVSGYVRHTFQQGGEDIWVWDISNGNLELPSPVVKNCTWQRTPIGTFEHTGVRLTFQRRRTGVVSLEQRLQNLETQIGGAAGSGVSLEALQQRIKALEDIIG